jgi:hypothetical protein
LALSILLANLAIHFSTSGVIAFPYFLCVCAKPPADCGKKAFAFALKRPALLGAGLSIKQSQTLS